MIRLTLEGLPGLQLAEAENTLRHIAATLYIAARMPFNEGRVLCATRDGILFWEEEPQKRYYRTSAGEQVWL